MVNYISESKRINNSKLDIGALFNWLSSWIQPSGEIYGFHNHSVWGTNPYRFGDFTCGHSTWASPFMPALTLALSEEYDEEGFNILKTLIDFQTESFQENSQYKHVGFQIGESLQSGLIHNAITNISLGLTVIVGKDLLDDAQKMKIKQSIEKNMIGCLGWGEGRPSMSCCCNQEYARIWAKLLYYKAFGSSKWKDEVIEDLDFMIKNFHIKGFPDESCEATYRSCLDAHKDNVIVEPAEYYGLIISPLVEAYEIYGDEKYLQRAVAVSRHVIRSAWKDNDGQTRFHRLWISKGGMWEKVKEPMLIAGMGTTLYGIHRCLQHCEDVEMKDFLAKCNDTYSHYQTLRGYFVSATGWDSECDIAPSTAWHAHDALYLIASSGVGGKEFWKRFKEEYAKVSVLLGKNCIWIEDGVHWTISDYYTNGLYGLIGRKDEKHFGLNVSHWIGGPKVMSERFNFKDMPCFIKTDNAVYLKDDILKEMDISNISFNTSPL